VQQNISANAHIAAGRMRIYAPRPRLRGVRRCVGEVDATPLVGNGPTVRHPWKGIAAQGLRVAGRFLDELDAAAESELGVDVGEVGLHGAR
jgi:hypothetical protein